MKFCKKVIFIITIICSLATIINIICYKLMPMYLSYKFKTDLRNASAIGIIGGADGPTSIYVTKSPEFFVLFPIIMALFSLFGIAYLIITRNKK
ncbi:MAG: sodium ion-translocating decarboxylase subunit beta [Herbinix sp.]|nr:sodium ion-translocating decarboxylase subunit beta [Herbinix sp.]